MTLLDEGTLYVAKLTGDPAAEIDGSGKLPADGEFDGNGPVDPARSRPATTARASPWSTA